MICMDHNYCLQHIFLFTLNCQYKPNRSSNHAFSEGTIYIRKWSHQFDLTLYRKPCHSHNILCFLRVFYPKKELSRYPLLKYIAILSLIKSFSVSIYTNGHALLFCAFRPIDTSKGPYICMCCADPLINAFNTEL